MQGDGFIRHLAAFTEALGVKHAPSIVYLSTVNWPDEPTRDRFIKLLTGKKMENGDHVKP
jgi:hypothetical protein